MRFTDIFDLYSRDVDADEYHEMIFKNLMKDDEIAQKSVSNLAERVFFQRMLKDIDRLTPDERIDEMIDRSVMIAEKLYNRLYK